MAPPAMFHTRKDYFPKLLLVPVRPTNPGPGSRRVAGNETVMPIS